MKVYWTQEAEQDRDDIWTYIAADNPASAARLDATFDVAAASLREFPERGRAGRVSGTRELMPHASYRMVYEVDGEAVVILALVHSARLWPPAR